MILTGLQVREKLGISKRKLDKLIAAGELVPIAPKKDGATKYFPKFDSKKVEEYRRAHREEFKMQRRETDSTPAALPLPSAIHYPKGISTRLTSIEEKLDRLLAIWA